VDGFGYPNPDTMRWGANQIPKEGKVCTRERSCNVSWSVPETDGEYFRCGRCR